MKTLVIVDFQRDFYHPDGSMYVNGAENAEDAIVDYINKHASELSDVIFTVDWHSPNHSSFIVNNGEWPRHCIQFTEGAGINNKIFFTCINKNITVKVFKKGNIDSIEEYGAFTYINHRIINGDEDIVIAQNEAQNSTVAFGSFDIIVCGIAGDYCVKNTIDNLIHNNCPVELQVSVLKEGIVSIDGGKILDEYIKENNLKVI